MIYKNIIIVTTVLFLVACSTSSKKETNQNELSKELPSSKQVIEKEDKAKPKSSSAFDEELLSSQSNDKVVTKSDYDKLAEAIKSNDENQIEKSASQLLAVNSKDIKVLNSLALYHYSRGRIDLAQFIIKKAISFDPKNSALIANYAVMLHKQGELKSAMLEFRKALELNPNDPYVAANLGSIFSYFKDYEKAAPALEIAYEKGFRDIKIANNYAVSLVATQKYDKAKKVYQDILNQQQNQSNREVLVNFSILLIEHLKDYDLGLEMINKLKFIGPPEESRNLILALENKAKSGVK